MVLENKQYKKTKIGFIPSDWDVDNLGVFCDKITKGTTPTTYGFKYQDTGINFIKVESIDVNGNFLPEFITHINEEANNYLKRSILKENDLLFSIAGALGRVAKVNKDILPANTNQALAIIRLKEKSSLNLNYLYYFLKGSQIQKHIERINVQSAQANLSLGDLNKFKILIPTFPEQNKIAEILTTVKDTIKKTNAIIKETQQLKKGLMEKLFTEGIGHTQFKKTKIGKIPEGWDVVKLGEICVQKSEKFEPRLSDEVMPYIGLEHIEAGLHKITGYGYSNETFSTKYLFKKDDILYGKLRPYLNKVWLSEFDGACTTEILVLSSNNRILQNILYYLLQQKRFIELANSRTEGTNLPRVNWKDLVKYNIALPPISEQKKIFEIISEVDAKLENEQNYKSELEQLKKGLSQVLLTGKVRVKV